VTIIKLHWWDAACWVATSSECGWTNDIDEVLPGDVVVQYTRACFFKFFIRAVQISNKLSSYTGLRECKPLPRRPTATKNDLGFESGFPD